MRFDVLLSRIVSHSVFLFPWGPPFPHWSFIQNIGVTLDDQRCFNKHYLDVCNRACRISTFILHTSSDFESINRLLVLCKSFKRNILGYCSVLPNQKLCDMCSLFKFSTEVMDLYTYRMVSRSTNSNETFGVRALFPPADSKAISSFGLAHTIVSSIG